MSRPIRQVFEFHVREHLKGTGRFKPGVPKVVQVWIDATANETPENVARRRARDIANAKCADVTVKPLNGAAFYKATPDYPH